MKHVGTISCVLGRFNLLQTPPQDEKIALLGQLLAQKKVTVLVNGSSYNAEILAKNITTNNGKIVGGDQNQEESKVIGCTRDQEEKGYFTEVINARTEYVFREISPALQHAHSLSNLLEADGFIFIGEDLMGQNALDNLTVLLSVLSLNRTKSVWPQTHRISILLNRSENASLTQDLLRNLVDRRCFDPSDYENIIFTENVQKAVDWVTAIEPYE
jgi:hypothetical protein